MHLPPHLLSTRAQRILHLLNTRTSPSHLAQIQAQIILLNLHPNTTIFSAFIHACTSLRLPFPSSSSPLFLLFSAHLPRPHVYICNYLIRTFVHSHPPSDTPFLIYSQMLKKSTAPNRYTYPPLFKSLSDLRDLRNGQTVQTHLVKNGHHDAVYVQNSLLSLYSLCGDLATCEQMFDEMPLRDVVSWTTMIGVYRNTGRLREALVVFRRMLLSGFLPNRVTVVSALAACAGCKALDIGAWIHGFVIRREWELDMVLATALVDMYGKCGKTGYCMNVFLTMSEKNVLTWNSLILGLASTKEGGQEAVRLFFRMENERVKPDEVTLTAVLNACSHSGMVRMGQWIFRTILDGKYGFMPGIKHYGCMVDMLGRAGLLEEALESIEIMPFEPNIVIWKAMLGGCMAHRNQELLELAVERLMELDPQNSAYYVLLSNFYSDTGRSSDALRVRELMRERGLTKGGKRYFPELQLKIACGG